MEDFSATLEPYRRIHDPTRATELPNRQSGRARVFCYLPGAAGGTGGSTETSATLPFSASVSET